MKKIIPIFYTEYGRYISRFRAIPFYMDCLIPIQRRLLLTLHETANGPKTVKCAKIIGHCLIYHPHGDASVYQSLVKLYDQDLIDKQGNFGSRGKIDAPASAFRYTEAKIKKWVDEFCFKYIDYVEWDEYEYENEPLFLPSIFPIGLTGAGLYTGIAFHTTIVPRYKVSDLAKRLKYLLTNKDKVTIYPNIEKYGCEFEKNDIECEKLLTTGSGSLNIIAKYEIDEDNQMHVLGRTPLTSSFTTLISDKENCSIIDLSGKDKQTNTFKLDILVRPKQRNIDLNQFWQYVYSKHLVSTINFKINLCDEKGKIRIYSVDELLKQTYSYYVQCVKYKNITKCLNEIDRKYKSEIIMLIRQALEKDPTIKTVQQIIDALDVSKRNITREEYDYEKDCWVINNTVFTDKEIEDICRTKSIKSLIEHEIDMQEINKNIVSIKNDIINNDNICFNELCGFCNVNY